MDWRHVLKLGVNIGAAAGGGFVTTGTWEGAAAAAVAVIAGLLQKQPWPAGPASTTPPWPLERDFQARPESRAPERRRP